MTATEVRTNLHVLANAFLGVVISEEAVVTWTNALATCRSDYTKTAVARWIETETRFPTPAALLHYYHLVATEEAERNGIAESTYEAPTPEQHAEAAARVRAIRDSLPPPKWSLKK